jgi:hypothetical protein
MGRTDLTKFQIKYGALSLKCSLHSIKPSYAADKPIVHQIDKERNILKSKIINY